MPRYYEDKPEGGACAGVKEDLGACLLQSDCVLQVARPRQLTLERGGRAGAGVGGGMGSGDGVPGGLRFRRGHVIQSYWCWVQITTPI